MRQTLDDEVESRRETVRSAPADHPERARYLSDLAGALVDRFHYAGAYEDVEESIAAAREASAGAGPGHPDEAKYLSNLGYSHLMRFSYTWSRDDLDTAVENCRRAVALETSDDLGWHIYRVNLADALDTRFTQAGGDPADLDEAIAVCRDSLRATPADHPYFHAHLPALMGRLETRFEGTRSVADIDEALGLARDYLAALAPEDPDLVTFRMNVGRLLKIRFDRLGQVEDITACAELSRELIADLPPGHPGYLLSLTNLGAALGLRYERTREPADLDEAIGLWRRALESTPPTHPERAERLASLGRLLADRFDRTGAGADVDAAVAVLRQAARASAGQPDRGGRLTGLAAVLGTRYLHTGLLADLDESIRAIRNALATSPPGHPERPRMQRNLGLGLLLRHRRAAAPGLLDEAADAERQALAAIPADDPDYPHTLVALSSVLRARFESAGERSDLDEAVAAARQALVDIAADHPGRTNSMVALADGLIHRAEQFPEGDDLDEAVGVLRAAAALAPSEVPEHAGIVHNLAAALRRQYELTGRPGPRAEARALFRRAARSAVADPMVRARSGRAWAAAAAETGDWAEAVEACRAVLDLVPRMVRQRLTRDDRHRQLEAFGGIATLAASAALRTGDAELAWTLLEQGRAVQIGQTLATRADAVLRAGHPDLAADLDRARGLLAEGRAAGRGGITDDPAASRQAAAEQLDAVLATVRGLDGFADFGLPPRFANLRNAVQDGVIVAVLVSGAHADALLLSERGADHVPLPGLTEAVADSRGGRFVNALQGPGAVDESVIDDTLAWLWDAVAEPVLDRLGHTAGPPGDAWPRVWWIPTGPMWALPVHAAGHHADPAGPGRRTVLDRVVSSYTLTAGSLRHARRQPVRPVRTPLVVGLREVAGHPPLPRAAGEAAWVCAALGGETTALVDSAATAAAVLAGLATATWTHFACHATTAADPADSHLVLYDRPLPVREIADLDLSEAYLAYLSACTTAFGGPRLRDEAIHISSAFTAAGFTHVVSALWQVTDRVAADFSLLIYPALTAGRPPAEAVHHAVRAIRDRHPGHPYLWAAQLHFGP